MGSRRAKRPLDPAAVKAADDAVRNKTSPPGRKLDPRSPEDAALRKEWMDAYLEASGGATQDPPANEPLNETCQTCPKPTIDLVYRHSDGSGVAGAKYHVYSVDPAGEKDGVFEKSGTLDGDGRAHIDDVPDVAMIEYYFEKDPQKYEIKPDAKPSKKPDKQEATSTLDAVGIWLWDTAQGDFNKDQSVSQIAVNAVLGLIPIVDQILDVRDIIAGLKDIIEFYMEDEEEQKKHKDVLGLDYETWIWINVFIIAIGCIPEVGSAVKGVLKGVIYYLKQLGKTAGQLSPRQLREGWELIVKILNRFGVGNAQQWLKQFPGQLDGWMDDAAKMIKGGLDSIDKMIEAARKYAKVVGGDDADKIIKRADAFKKALQKAYQQLDAMKAKINNWIKEQVETLTSGAHKGEARGATGTKGAPVENRRVQTEAEPPEIKYPDSGTEPNRIYSARELLRRAEEPGPFHNFPESFNDEIFKGTRTVVSDDYVVYSKPGTITLPGKPIFDAKGNRIGETPSRVIEGTFEIGVRPSATGRSEIITHRFFRPN
jgi:hypothetical protein